MRTRKKIALALIATFFAGMAGCGEDAPPPPPKRSPARGGGGGGKAGGAAKPGPTLVLKPKVDAAYRKDLTAADFTADPTGEVNHDPFFSYLVQPATRPGAGAPVQDE